MVLFHSLLSFKSSIVRSYQHTETVIYWISGEAKKPSFSEWEALSENGLFRCLGYLWKQLSSTRNINRA